MSSEHSPRTDDAQNGSACEAATHSQQRSNRSSTSKKARTTTGRSCSSSFTHGPGPSTPSSARASESSSFTHRPDTSTTTSAPASRSSSFMNGPDDPSTTSSSARASRRSSSFTLHGATDPSTPSAPIASDTDSFTPAAAAAARNAAMAQLMALQRYTQTAQEQFDAANAAVAVASGAPQRVSKRGRPSPNCADNSPQFTSPPAFSFHNSAAVYSPAARSRHSLAGGLQTQEDDVDTKLQLEHLFYKEEKRDCENKRNSYNSTQAESTRISTLKSQASDLIDFCTFQRANIQKRLQACEEEAKSCEEEAKLKDGEIEYATKKRDSMHQVLKESSLGSN